MDACTILDCSHWKLRSLKPEHCPLQFMRAHARTSLPPLPLSPLGSVLVHRRCNIHTIVQTFVDLGGLRIQKPVRTAILTCHQGWFMKFSRVHNANKNFGSSSSPIMPDVEHERLSLQPVRRGSSEEAVQTVFFDSESPQNRSLGLKANHVPTVVAQNSGIYKRSMATDQTSGGII